MASFIHIVGRQGVGKTWLSLALAQRYAARGQVCAGDGEPFIFDSRHEALREAPGADVYFIEHLDDSTLDALPGELVIRMERVEEQCHAA